MVSEPLSYSISFEEHSLSPFDAIIHYYSKKNSLDWRLVASMIFVESKFQPNARSHVGAMGLMQLMPVVAREQNVLFAHDPKENIRGGVNHFSNYLKLIEGKTSLDSLQIALAAYNAGLGHVRDAQRLAQRMKKDPSEWSSVKKALLLLQKPFYYQRAKYGYCQGNQAVTYVSRVMSYYEKLQETKPSYLLFAENHVQETSKFNSSSNES